jgi:ferrous iron transport protein A
VALLSNLAVGGTGKVASVLPLDEIGLRLMEMGITPGVDVRVIGTAPFGDPIELDIRGYRLSLRKTEASRVHLQDP